MYSQQIRNLLLLTFLMALPILPVMAYSVLTHQAIIDAAWQRSLAPLIRTKYPNISAYQLREAHAYAYGGAIIQDMGYYPMGSRLFTDLTHYVRTGEFVENLLAKARNSNEFAFALGAMSHYYADLHGHPEGTNKSVPEIYPKLEKHFGHSVTFEQDPVSHTRVEFAFDVLYAARKAYAPEAYRDFIGFKVARPLLEKAFQETYGLKLRDIFVYLPLSEYMFRLSVKSLIPQFTKVAWQQNKGKIEKADGQAVPLKKLDTLHTHTFSKGPGKAEKPGTSARIMSFVFWVAPKVGPLSPLKFTLPTPEAEKLFIKSFDASVLDYEKALGRLQEDQLVFFKTNNLDTGSPTYYLEYALADNAHRIWVNRLENDRFRRANATLKNYLLDYYAFLPPPPDFRKEKKEYAELKDNLTSLRNYQPK